MCFHVTYFLAYDLLKNKIENLLLLASSIQSTLLLVSALGQNLDYAFDLWIPISSATYTVSSSLQERRQLWRAQRVPPPPLLRQSGAAE